MDSINVLIIQAFSALAAGGTIICTQYLGQKNHEMANKSARQALFYHNSHFCLHRCAWTCFPCTAS
ncbi:MAG: MATE family efflux transporter [Ruminococcus sp.]